MRALRILGAVVLACGGSSAPALAAAVAPCRTTKIPDGTEQTVYNSPVEGTEAIVGGFLPYYVNISPLTPPLATAAPSIAGTASLGGTLTATLGTWTGMAPFRYTYEWVRCSIECDGIAAPSTQPTHTLTKQDAVTSDAGLPTTIYVVVSAFDQRGLEGQAGSCGVVVSAPPQRPRTVGGAEFDSTMLLGPASEIPQILAHGGYTASFYPLRRGRLELYWSSTSASKLADAKLVIRRADVRVSLKVRLTKLGRRLLSRAGRGKFPLESQAEFTPLHGPGGGGIGSFWTLSESAPALEN